ncbi:MAG: response regulator [Acidobacteriota bacterium]
MTTAEPTTAERHAQLLRQGIQAARAKDKVTARRILRQAVALANDHELTWMWLASVAETRAEAQACVETVLRINPENAQARDWLDRALETTRVKPLPAETARPRSVNNAHTARSRVTAEPSRAEVPVRDAATPPRVTSRLEPSAQRSVLNHSPESGRFHRQGAAPVHDPSAAMLFTPTEGVQMAKVVLVVDDSPTVRKLVAVTLEREGYCVISASDGMEALAKLNDLVPDLILLDIAMPNLDGYQVCKVIKANEKTRDLPIVMLSGKDGFFDKVRGRMSGATDYVTKPFEPKALVTTLDKHLHRVGLESRAHG